MGARRYIGINWPRLGPDLAPTPRHGSGGTPSGLAQGWTAAATAEALERDPHPSAGGRRPSAREGPALIFEQSFPSRLKRQREELKAAVQELPEQAGIQLANWYWKGVRQFVWEQFGTSLSRSSCLNWLHRLGFAFKRPKKRLLKADQAKRKSCGGVRRHVGGGSTD